MVETIFNNDAINTIYNLLVSIMLLILFRKSLWLWRMVESFNDYLSIEHVCFIYAILSSSSLALFAARYKFELILWLPFFILILAWYFKSALGNSGLTENPEKLITSRRLLSLLAFNAIIFFFLLSANIEILDKVFYESLMLNW